MRRLAALLSLLAWTSAAIGNDSRPPVEAPRPAAPRFFHVLARSHVNQVVAEEIGARLGAMRLRNKDVRVEVRNGGRVVLTGYVGSADDLKRVDRVVRQSLGVRLVENRLKVVSGPPAAETTDLSLL